MPSQIIPCADCADATRRFEERGFRVLGCVPHASQAQMCVISFEPPAPAAAAALAAPAAGAAAAAAPAMTPTQVRTAQAIVNLFETGEVLGRYGQVTVLSGDPGRLTYGRSQTTLGSGNLNLLLSQYCQNHGARFGARLQPLLPRFAAGDQALDGDTRLHNLLRACADDPVMRETQDNFFDSTYWQPALRAATKLGLRSALAVAVVYDSHVHGSWVTLRDLTNSNDGSVAAIGEQAWIRAYVRNRRAWLAGNKLTILQGTVYRMDAFQRLIDLGQWGLELPLVVRGIEISTASLAAMPPECYDGPPPGSRPLGLQQPLLRGLDVRLVQLALSDSGSDIKADGVYGQGSVRCVKELQIARGLPVTGVLDLALIGELVH
jgi:chitosanase